MKKLIVGCVLFFMVMSGCFAQPVLVVVRTGDADPETPGVRLSAIIEDAIMEEFFEANHLVFNTGIVGLNYEVPFRIAEENGADLLVLVDLFFCSGTEASLPESADFKLYSPKSGKILKEGVLASADVEMSREVKSLAEACKTFGKALAAEIVMKP